MIFYEHEAFRLAEVLLGNRLLAILRDESPADGHPCQAVVGMLA